MINANWKLREAQALQRWLDLPLGFIVVILNICEVIILARLENKRKVYECYLLSLSITDLLFGLWKISVSVMFFVYQKESMEMVYAIYLFFVSSIFHLSWISVNRLWAIWKPIHYRMTWSKKKVYIAIAVIWLLSIAVSVLTLLMDIYVSNDDNVTISTNCSVAELDISFSAPMRTTLASVIILADVFFIVITTVVVYMLQRKKRKPKLGNGTSKVENKATSVCVLITLVFIVLTLPYPITQFIWKDAPLWSNVMLVLNSAMNSAVYFFRGKLNCFDKRKNLPKRKHSLVMEGKIIRPINNFNK